MHKGARTAGLIGVVTIGIWIPGCKSSEAPAPSPAAPTEKAVTSAPEPAKSGDYIPVTVDNFPRAETDRYFDTAVKQAGGVGKFYHYREVMPVR